MALGALMAHQPSPQFLKSHPTATTVFSSHNRSSPSSSSSSLAAVSLPRPSGLPPPSSVAFLLSDSDVAAAQHLLHLSSDTDPDDASHNLSGHPAEATPTPTATCQISRGGDDSNSAAPAPTSRKRRFASISAIYSRTKPLKTWKVGS